MKTTDFYSYWVGHKDALRTAIHGITYGQDPPLVVLGVLLRVAEEKVAAHSNGGDA